MSSVTSFISMFDIFGKRVSLTYQGKETFKTLTGGLLTIFSKLGIFIYMLILLVSVIEKDGAKITNTQFQRNLLFDHPGVNLSKSNFDMGFYVLYIGQD